MPQYRVEIEGQNFLVEMNGRVEKLGFFTTRFVAAPDINTVETQAVQMLRETQSLRAIVRNLPADPPVMLVTEMAELQALDGIENLEPGFIWYQENPKRWWQFWKQ